ncbi:hypothetical protein Taro_047212 [Colocasia esculenta]|uniref:Uncharacterized protein n=1 Tax=Colocasia esculenta TaxID=4460 RepID=A0A843WUP2_COLES|nr:hypothetical protein [Colocasia esculenta]
MVEVLPTMRLFIYCFSVKAFGDWLYFAARSGQQILGRMPSSVHNWKRNIVFIHSSSGWPVPTVGYKYFYAKDVSTHPSMVSTHQHRFKGNMCKNVETVSTQVKSVSIRVEVFQVLAYSGRHTLRAGRH